MQPAVYILANRPNGTLYVGVTGDLIARAWLQRAGRSSHFCVRYKVRQLVYFELHDDMRAAIAREKRMKKRRRAWKIRRVEEANPGWKDLWPSLLG